jgi:hypothetical protein
LEKHMTDRSRVAVLSASASAISLACLLAACGSYDNKTGTGGAAGTGGTGGAGGSSATGGTGGATGGTGGATGGTGGATGGTGGTGGATGGSAGATGGSSGGGQAGSGASGAPMGGASGSGADAGMGGAAGGSAGAAACTDTAPCGGDLVGTWTVAGCGLTLGGMANLIPAGIGCTEAPITAGAISVSGTWTAMEGGMFMDGTTTVGEVTMELAPECLMISGFAAECDRINFDSGGMPNAVCVDNPSTSGCTCVVPINQTGGLAAVSYEGSVAGALSGTYTTADSKVTTSVPSSTPAGMLTTEYSYCVADTTLTMTVVTQTNAGTVTGPIVFQKQ